MTDRTYPAVIGDLEGPESIVRIGQFTMHGNLPP
jgi:hypothetical protein